jgi:hypothetical protein
MASDVNLKAIKKIEFFLGRTGAEGGIRTHTLVAQNWILSPARLPISPLRRIIFLTLSLMPVNFGIIKLNSIPN